jgi:hypothetical protein
MFYWKRFKLDEKIVNEIKKIYRDQLPNNNFFFQQLKLPITHFLGREVQRFVLIQVEPNATGRIHTDYRPPGYGDKLALQIPLENCEASTTYIWESDYTPPIQYTSNMQPYNFYDPVRCKKVTSFNLIEPTFFRTDLPHSVDNPTNNVRRAISIRFKEDPWDLIGEEYE